MKHPNLMTYCKESPYNMNQGSVKKEGCILLRQFVCFNLNEKLDIIPQFLTIIEKKWLIF